MIRKPLILVAGITLLGVMGCEPRDPNDPPMQTTPVVSEDEDRPPATTRAASQPPAVPIEDLVDTVPAPAAP